MPDITITKRFDFDAAHWLPNVPDGHKCKRLHGHTYEVMVICEGPIDPEMGWLVDYAEIAAAWKPLEEKLDHRCLNDILGLANPTTEILAHWILERMAKALPCVVAVRVFESATTYAEARRSAA